MSRSARQTWFPRVPRLARNQRPVPLAPRHRRVWRGLRPDCSCGLRWRNCPDRHMTVPTEPTGPTAPTMPNRPAWADATVANPQVGRVGWLTLAQTWRANGGRW
ncbi:hypothetical protein [Micromonospora eburnea]|uniref:Uncharacterized protein n=1 Tax=Micromonospora eburnea TaxID=227316 RepID=A0A1C6VMF1_9ACTN|nr:hypothetical protein [Micromonospora eburnea]SCL67274.1 hypothetical protein GA0070604_5941 [Micromonospora eburnea]